MRHWLYMLGGLVLWTTHFLGVYAIASASDVWWRTRLAFWDGLGLAFSAVCLAATAALLAVAVRSLRRRGWARPGPRAVDDPVADLAPYLAATSAGVGFMAILYQSAIFVLS